MKYFYIAIQVEENGKYYAYAIKVSENDNLLSKLKIKNIVTANICSTKKRAKELVEFWNANHKSNGKYLFDETF